MTLTNNIIWKSYNNLTNDDFDSIEKYYDNNTNNSKEKMTDIIYNIIDEECQENINNSGYKFTCKSIGFEDSNPTYEIYGINYLGICNPFEYYVYKFEPIVDFNTYSEEPISYNNPIFEPYITFDMYERDNGEYIGYQDAGLEKWECEYEEDYDANKYATNKVVSQLKTDFKPFIRAIKDMTNKWEKILYFEGPEFRYFLNSFDFEYGFDADGNCIEIKQNF